MLTVGAAGMYCAIVILKPVLQEFGVSRSVASIPYMSTMIGFGLGGILMGRISDRIGVMPPLLFGGVSMGAGFYIASLSTSLWQLSLAHGVLIGLFGMSASFAPLVADISHWFTRRRGIAVAIVICGSYVAGAIWPPTIQHHFDTIGWRDTYLGFAWICFAAMTIFGLLLYRRFGGNGGDDVNESPELSKRPLGYSSGGLQSLLCVAGIGCCAAMAMPQVHIIAHAVDLGFSAAPLSSSRHSEFGRRAPFGCSLRANIGFCRVAVRRSGAASSAPPAAVFVEDSRISKARTVVRAFVVRC